MRTVLGCLLALSLLTTGCGSDAGAADADAERAVREAAARYAEAQRADDPRKVCDELYAEELKHQLKVLGGSCEAFVGDANRDPKYTLTVNSVRFNGDRALATGRSVEDGKRDTEQLPFVREDGEWRLTLRMPEIDRSTLDADQRAAVKTVDRYSQLVRARDAQRLCTELVSKELHSYLADNDAECVKDEYGPRLKRASRDYRFSVTGVEVKGGRALVKGHNVYDGLFPPDDLALVREADGQWRLTHEEPK